MPNTYLCHHGIKGMKWGVRRFQNKDGSLTKAGQKRVAKHLIESEKNNRLNSKRTKEFNESADELFKNAINDNDINLLKNKFAEMDSARKKIKTGVEDIGEDYESPEYKAMSKEVKKEILSNEDKYIGSKELAESIKKDADSKKIDFWEYKAYRRAYDYMMSGETNPKIHDKYSKMWESRNKKELKKTKSFDKAWDEYYYACKDVSAKLLGTYGDIDLGTFSHNKLNYELSKRLYDYIENLDKR